MTRTGKIAATTAGFLLIVLVLIIVAIATFDWNRLKPTINENVSARLHRPFAIRGDLGVAWSRQEDETGWRRWIPWPHVHAEDIILGNPAGLPQMTMVSLPRVEATLAPLALLHKTVWLPWIKLVKPDVRLIRVSDKHNNWTFTLDEDDGSKRDSPSAWSFRLDTLLFDQGRITVDDKVSRTQMTVLVDSLGKPLPFSEVTGKKTTDSKVGDYVFGLKVQGSYNGQPLEGTGKIGGMLSLHSDGTPFPVQADIRSGKTRIAFSGTVNDPLRLGGVDVKLIFSGNSLSELYNVTGILLPDTPPFETSGHLVAKISSKQRSVFDYRAFSGRIGESDIHGTLTYSRHEPRPKLEGHLESKQLRLADLGPLIGVDSGKGGEKNAQRNEKNIQPVGKVLPYDRFETDKWRTMDADVRFKGRRIEHGTTLPISDLTTHLTLNNGDLHLRPLTFGLANGTLSATVHLDGNKTPMQGSADIHARRLKLNALLPNVEIMKKTLGELNGDAEIRGAGNSVAALLGSSNGNMKLLMNDGLISRNLMEILGLNVGNYLVGKIFGDDDVRVNCAAANLDVTHGVVRPQIFAFDTENALVNITGTASFASEQLDVTIDPESKGIRIMTLRSPLYVRGTFSHPDAGVALGPLIARGAVAAALATLVTPAAALLALISPSEGEQNQCSAVLSQMKR